MSSRDESRSNPGDLLTRARRAKAMRLLKQGVASSAMVLTGVQGLAACSETPDEIAQAQAAAGPNVPAPGAGGKADWAQDEGERRPDLVHYDGEFWTEESGCNTRAGCMNIDVILKVHVKRFEGADLSSKRIGLVFALPGWEPGRTETALGDYHASNGEWEEWHVRVRMYAWSTYGARAVVFNPWYQDGLGNTYYDDNNGEFHVAAAHGDGGVLRQNWCCVDEVTKIDATAGGVTGKIGVSLADLDFDKKVELLWSIDNWATSTVFGMGDGVNAWHWVRDGYWGSDIWAIDLDISGNVQAFEYAIVYKHGVVHDADTYEFWDNSGGYNYVVYPQ